ncbi:hypothetical protein DRO64_08570 [Candidatus Bathyarchaeota archaeon]|nr:MAG: hypothetical protein DRO64_08570 [Candidatus Bathyarchaeota archaeon]
MTMFFDSDVILMPRYIEEILKMFEEKKDAVGVQGWMILPWLVPLKEKWSASKENAFHTQHIFQR